MCCFVAVVKVCLSLSLLSLPASYPPIPLSRMRGEMERGRFAKLDTAVIGAVEELSMTPDTQTLIRDQFETKFFGPVNVIKAVLPSMRARGQGHVLVLSDISEYFSIMCDVSMRLLIWGCGTNACIDTLLVEGGRQSENLG